MRTNSVGVHSFPPILHRQCACNIGGKECTPALFVGGKECTPALFVGGKECTPALFVPHWLSFIGSEECIPTLSIACVI